MKKSNIPAALLAFDSEPLQALLEQVIAHYDLTFSSSGGLPKVILTDRGSGVEFAGCCSSWPEAFDMVLGIWQLIETHEETAPLFASKRNGDKTEKNEPFAVLEAEAA